MDDTDIHRSTLETPGEFPAVFVGTKHDVDECFNIISPPVRRCNASLLQVSGKRSEGKEADDFHGGEYEAAVQQEKQDDRRSHRELVGGGGLSEESDSGSEQEEVSVAALNVRTTRVPRVTHNKCCVISDLRSY